MLKVGPKIIKSIDLSYYQTRTKINVGSYIKLRREILH